MTLLMQIEREKPEPIGITTVSGDSCACGQELWRTYADGGKDSIHHFEYHLAVCTGDTTPI